jgi:hypothetical protein
MKHQRLSKFSKIFLLVLIGSFSDTAFATPVRVIKSVRGKSLIIYNKDTNVKPGIYQLVEGKKEESLELDNVIKKDKFISLSLDAAFLNQKSTALDATGASSQSDVKSLNSNLTYGWNLQTWEWGLFVSYGFNTVGTFDTKTLVAGLLFDKNFSPNNLENDFVFGLRLQGGAGQEDSSSYTKAAQVTLVQPALYLKWFGLNPNVGLTTEVGYRMQESKTDATKLQTQGSYVRLGVTSYF